MGRPRPKHRAVEARKGEALMPRKKTRVIGHVIHAYVPTPCRGCYAGLRHRLLTLPQARDAEGPSKWGVIVVTFNTGYHGTDELIEWVDQVIEQFTAKEEQPCAENTQRG